MSTEVEYEFYSTDTRASPKKYQTESYKSYILPIPIIFTMKAYFHRPQ